MCSCEIKGISAANSDILGNPTVNDDVCPQEVDYMDAKAVADQLGIKLHRVDFIQEYWDRVFDVFLSGISSRPNTESRC